MLAANAQLTILRYRSVGTVIADRYITSSLMIDSPDTEAIRSCARKHKIIVALGFSKNFHHTLYTSQCTISSLGEVLMHWRKIHPTHMKRKIFGNGSSNKFQNVVHTRIGKISQLACWDYTQSLLKYHAIAQQAARHIASWRPVPPCKTKEDLWSMSRDVE